MIETNPASGLLWTDEGRRPGVCQVMTRGVSPVVEVKYQMIMMTRSQSDSYRYSAHAVI
jgi:hypothetical protein